ncbi:BtrH N-terminal domain-containing protein [Clostridium sp. AL.422]|uniref:BtrH N-terminal domain-containing protein n=1 Tax=Clostridium TaxID=1485 RepID=UPI00293DDD34|nr:MULTISPECIES: BtrH N-terminal domain-containing protein [unclassified Clostridium]MDV4150493.1 BtrH N-terminal domain-containing protein [Clostridium sp. AL.422]
MKKIVDKFKPTGGKHCITSALKQIFDYYNYHMTEEMIFGIGSGLSFCYINLEKSPMLAGRTMPFEFEKKLGERLNIEIKCKSSRKYKSAFDKTIELLDENKPVLVYADMAYLDYLNLGKDNHFGGHAIVIFGYDYENQNFYISDRDNSDYAIRTPKGNIAEDFHLVSYTQIETARSSNHKPFPSKNKYLDINFNEKTAITKSIIFAAINETCENMLNPPAQLLGLNGIKKFSKEVLKWDKFDNKKLNSVGITNYFQISADGGTGGGIFRKMYGDFLIQACDIVEIEEFKEIGNKYIAISNKWDSVGDLLWKLSETLNRNLLKEISVLTKEIYDEETTLLTELKEFVNA